MEKIVNILVVAPDVAHVAKETDLSKIRARTRGEIVLCETIIEAESAIEKEGRSFHIVIIDPHVANYNEQTKISLFAKKAKELCGRASIDPLIVEARENLRPRSDWATHLFGSQMFLRDFINLCATEQ